MERNRSDHKGSARAPYPAIGGWAYHAPHGAHPHPIAREIDHEDAACGGPPNAPSVSGRAAIRGFFAREMDGAKKAGVAFSLGAKPAGGVSGGMGWQSGTYAVKDKAGKVVEAGKYLSVSKKQGGGKWLYVRDTWNADGASPPPAAAPAPAAKK